MAEGLSGILAMLQLSDAALPIGRHAHALGLERHLREGRASDPLHLRSYSVSALLHGAARMDGAASAQAHNAMSADDLPALLAVDQRLDRMKLTCAAQTASRRCGSRLAALAPSLIAGSTLAAYCQAVRDAAAPGHLAVVTAAAAAAAQVPQRDAVVMEMRGIATLILSAAVRLDALPAAAAQILLAGLAPEILQATTIALATAPHDMGSSAAAGLEIAAMNHSREAGRLFAT